MRRIALFLFLMCSAAALAQSCVPGGGVICTPNLGLWQPPAHYQNWSVPLNANASILDTWSATVLSMRPAASQQVTQPAGTYTGFNAPQSTAATPFYAFGFNLGIPTGFLTQESSTVFSLDSSTLGDAAAVLNGSGIQYQGGSGVTTGDCLVAGSDSAKTFVPASCTSAIGAIYYQTVDNNGIPLAQEPILNFDGTTLIATAGGGLSSVSLAPSGVTPGTYENAQFTIDTYGRVTNAVGTGATSRVCNANGCYRIEPDGTIEQWGTITGCSLGAFATHCTATITFPISWTSISNVSVVVTPTLPTVGVVCGGGLSAAAEIDTLATTTVDLYYTCASGTGTGTSQTFWHGWGN